VDNGTYLEFHWSMKNRLNKISLKLFNISYTFHFTVSSAQSRYWGGYCLVWSCFLWRGWRFCLASQRLLLYIMGLNKLNSRKRTVRRTGSRGLEGNLESVCA